MLLMALMPWLDEHRTKHAHAGGWLTVTFCTFLLLQNDMGFLAACPPLMQSLGTRILDVRQPCFFPLVPDRSAMITWTRNGHLTLVELIKMFSPVIWNGAPDRH